MKARATLNPPIRFRSLRVEYGDDAQAPPSELSLLDDRSRSILSKNDSPDLSFTYSANPYRGCSHACAYCYARPSHEYLDLGAGTDFDTKIVVKRDAPQLLAAAFDKPSWKGELVMFSGVTDCYQPAEKQLELTRRMLEVCLAYRNPVGVISKSALVLRDLDLFRELTCEAHCHINVSLAFIDEEMARALEPWAPSPARRLAVIEALAKAGISVGVMCAPVIPGLNDSQMPELLERAAAAGATQASWSMLRLPGAVQEVFTQRLRTALPLAADKVLHRIHQMRGGADGSSALNDARFHVRHTGQGPYAESVASLFETTAKRLGLARATSLARSAPMTFRRPNRPAPQLSLW